MKLTKADRNLHPHAEARLAMALWSHEYAFEQRGGVMDFWDGLDDARKRLCIATIDAILAALDDAGRAPRALDTRPGGTNEQA